MKTKQRGEWYLAPSDDEADDYSAGFDDNHFATQAEAEAAIPALKACGDDFAAIDWVAVKRPDSVPKAVARWLDQAAQEWNDTDERGLAR